MFLILCLIFTFSLICYGLYFLVVKPWLSLQFYKKQGCQMTYFPLGGNQKACMDALSSHGDFFWNFKQQLKKNPKLKAIGGNLLDAAQIYLCDADAIADYYKQPEKYVRSTRSITLFKLLVGEGLATSEGEFWKRHRKIVSKSLHYSFIKEIIPDIAQITSRILEDLKQKGLEDVEAMSVFEQITGAVTERLFFGMAFNEYKIRGVPLTKIVNDLSYRIGDELSTSFYTLFGKNGVCQGILPRHKRLMEDIKEVHNFARNLIEARRKTLEAAKEKGDLDKYKTDTLLDILLTGSDFTTQEIIDEFFTFLLGGTDVTGSFLAMVVYNLSQNPQFKDRLIDEANKHLNKDPSQVTIEDLNEMEFTTAFLKESLRVASPSPQLADRVAVQDHKLGDLNIKKGTIVSITVAATGFHPDFFENESTFDPERWTNNSKNKEFIAKSSRIFLPFSAGGHNCIGQHLAMIESRVALGLFVKMYDFVLPLGYEHKMTLGSVQKPLNRLSFKLIPRNI